MERVGDRIIVIGVGWAGISAAQSLLSAGVSPDRILMLERAPHAGGRAFSFTDKETGLELDNGQHVLLGCCDEFVDLLQQFQLSDGFQFQRLLHIPVFHDGRRSTLLSHKLVGPSHLLPGLLRYGHLSRRDRFRALRAASGFLRPDVEKLDDVSFATWLEGKGQSKALINHLWDLVGTAVLNGHADQISAGLTAKSFRMGVVAGWKQARLGLFTAPLGELARKAVEKLQATGVQVCFSTAVIDMIYEGDRISGVHLKSGERLAAGCVLSTVPHDALLRMWPTSLDHHDMPEKLQQFAWSPILNVFTLYDRSVMLDDLFASTDLGGMFVFNRGRLMKSSELDGRWLSVSISAADEYRNLSQRDIMSLIQRAIARACPKAAEATVLSSSVVWQPRATFLASPGTGRLRPNSVTDIAGLVLAGDWTNTGWPASLEGAVRSGQAAARVCLNEMSS